MSPILLITLIVVAVFAGAYPLCEWVARKLKGAEPDHGKDGGLAVRWRVSEWSERGNPDAR